ncbi:MAG: helix-turn-helix transcriptional regulator [Candidatus Kapaibacterium sp.]
MKEIVLNNQVVGEENVSPFFHQQMKVNDESQLTLTRVRSDEPIRLLNSFTFKERMAALHFIVNTEARFSQEDLVPPAYFKGDKCNLMILQPHQTAQTISGKGDMMMASFYINLDKFFSLLDSAAEAMPKGFLKSAEKNSCSCNEYQWNPDAYRVIMQILHDPTLGSATPLLLESRMLELVAILLKSRQCDVVEKISITRSDVEKIHHAADLLLQQMKCPPSLAQLARSVGTNEFTLKKGFREVYNRSAYQYLLQRRMEKGMEALMATNTPIAEIGWELGYEDPSAFTRAFARYFCLTPSSVRRRS